MKDLIIELKKINTRFGTKVVHKDVDLSVKKEEIFAIVGGSGSGKSTLLKEMIALLRPASGTVSVLGKTIKDFSEEKNLWLRKKTGVLFQGGALFSSLTVLENVALPIKEHSDIPLDLINEIAMLKIALTGLHMDSAALYPNELSGGMRKRAALARSISMDPELLFLDEPTSGLDPVSAGSFDELILQLKNSLALTVVMVTHDFDSLWRISDRVAILGDKKIVAVGPIDEISGMDNPIIKELFQGPRGRAAMEHNKTWKQK
jgi:phospholipid/cholesterol/gamma-HCH transport system ATP-binding protein